MRSKLQEEELPVWGNLQKGALNVWGRLQEGELNVCGNRREIFLCGADYSSDSTLCAAVGTARAHGPRTP